jgi:hypothetical protein
VQYVPARWIVDLHSQLQSFEHGIPRCRRSLTIFRPEFHSDNCLNVSAASETETSACLSSNFLLVDKDRFELGALDIPVPCFLNFASRTDVAVVARDRRWNQISKWQSIPISRRQPHDRDLKVNVVVRRLAIVEVDRILSRDHDPRLGIVEA